MAATLGAVAKQAGVSVSTASRAFNEPGRLSPSTVERVVAAARELGYQPNHAARALATGRRGSIALVVPDVANPVFASFVKAAQAQGWQQRQAVLLADTDESPELERRLIARLLPQVDGIVLCSSRLELEELVSLDARIVLVNREVPQLPSVLVDASTGMRQAVEHLHALGHRSLAYVQGSALSWSNSERLRLITENAERLGVALEILHPQAPTYDGGIAAAANIRACGATAVVTYNDLVALGAVAQLTAMGIAVPGDVSVIGVDDIAMASMSVPPITTIAVPMDRAGRVSIEVMQRLLGGHEGEPALVRLETQLKVRGSTAEPVRKGTPA
ncbi:LacI family DNA-binding transcriptional regulator [Amycolatopsis alkalitolerans]|uniref:LacI family transcriptional regulator n=1 Tax=Amycolatopsis alkalitolerans TaxID=2547244 RepID=A0A5C4M3V8_9PSEU|nr:LacI family DNA-binding transcriptional regulator [Amycolatopsis alkalitolerans]TNC26563.1 LacI family transcriptional regulator [Amycolatopsis alkalitolerans]